ncbi:hypothetical protein PTTG_00734 [Puccinia triticina 1-1 BBBD Race 1]|uniref:Uncharacterized protein n=1 Tax=Puccinia triticina (isolate 1-1 / race 1 (BBBD)) TaxID=630390 RepID=A0A0C4EJ17_PUCT1|nr:hypothetical protein PTTG_00734 [Puccinia triticina 1-1 BBBD Race 1]
MLVSTPTSPARRSPARDHPFLWHPVQIRTILTGSSYFVTAYFVAVGVKYVLSPVAVEKRTNAWKSDNNAVIAVLTQAIDSANLRHVWAYQKDAHGMWIALQQAHLDSSTGGRIFWIRKLLLTKMEGDDILSHLDNMSNFYERLNALVTPEKPLTPSDVHSATLLGSIPDDWVDCVSHLMNQDDVKTETIILALENKHTRRQANTDTAVLASYASLNKGKPKSNT